MDIRSRARAVPAWGWWAVLAFVGLGVLVWHDWYTHSPDEESWLDPQQPALQLDSPSASIPSVRPKARPYPPCMAKWPGTAIGDC